MLSYWGIKIGIIHGILANKKRLGKFFFIKKRIFSLIPKVEFTTGVLNEKYKMKNEK